MTHENPRILFIADTLGYPGGVAHGCTSYYLEVLPALVEAGVRLTTCFLRDPHPAAVALRDHGVESTFLSTSRWNPSAVFPLAAMARENRCNIMHAVGIKATLMARMATRLVPARTIVHVHDQQLPGFLISNLHRIFARPTDLGICVSRAVQATTLRGYHMSQKQLRVIPNGIRLERFHNVPATTGERVRNSLGIGGEARVLGMFGRMYPVKSHRAMIGMMPRIVAACPDVLLLLAGGGPEREACEALVGTLGLGHQVMFLGHRSDIPELLAACDVFVMPSESEGLPMAAIEALAMGKPVVGFDVGGMSEVIDDGKTGRLVPFGDANAFIDAVLALLFDADLLAGFGQRALHAVRRFSFEGHVRALLDCYREQAPP
jgi:glycosyltransferase involved in cell wall biosynthesis